MKTAELITRLADSNAPVRSSAVTMRFAIAAGAVASFAVMLAWLGFRPDLADALRTGAYWLKFFYPLALAALALRTAERLAHPGTPAKFGWEALPLAFVCIAAVMQWVDTPAAQRLELLMGQSSSACPWRILAISLPLLLATLWAMQRLAPTRPGLAGCVAGLFAGAAGAWIYAFACTETSAVFLAVWYSTGIALVTLLGAVAGRWLLRW